MLTTQFENIHMDENNTFTQFHTKLTEMVRVTWAHGEPIPEGKICSKIQRTLPERFHLKVTLIEEHRDPEKIKVEDLVVALQIFQLKFDTSKKNSIALNTSHTPSKSKVESEDESNDDKEDVALLGKKFLKYFGKRKGKSTRKEKSFDQNKNKVKSSCSKNKSKDTK